MLVLKIRCHTIWTFPFAALLELKTGYEKADGLLFLSEPTA